MQLDKKTVAGELKFVLPDKIGSVRTLKVGDKASIIESMRS